MPVWHIEQYCYVVLQLVISLIGFVIGFGIYGPVSLYGVMALEAAPTHLSGTSHAIASFACNGKQHLLLLLFCMHITVYRISASYQIIYMLRYFII